MARYMSEKAATMEFQGDGRSPIASTGFQTTQSSDIRRMQVHT